jgi:hypothetical protein
MILIKIFKLYSVVQDDDGDQNQENEIFVERYILYSLMMKIKYRNDFESINYPLMYIQK